MKARITLTSDGDLWLQVEAEHETEEHLLGGFRDDKPCFVRVTRAQHESYGKARSVIFERPGGNR